MKMNETGAAWLREHGACPEGFRWATSECATLREVWDTASPDWLIWVATRQGLLRDRDLWLFACWSAEHALPHWIAVMPDDRRPQVAIETRRRWLDGLATDAELAAAGIAAGDAVAAARDAAGDAAAAWAAAAAAWAAAGDAAAAAWDAAAAAWAAAWAAAASAGDAQAKWLRENVTPAFVDETR
jgi:hypothetical protein